MNTWQQVKSLCALVLLCWSVAPGAHPLAPSLLELLEAPGGVVDVLWKTPANSPPGSRLKPLLPVDCKQVVEASSAIEGTARVYRWQMQCPGSLVGSEVGVDNIASSQANALLRVVLEDGRTFSQVLTPEASHFVVPERQSKSQVFTQYLVFGAEHLATGIDHVLFIVSLVLLVGLTRSLIATITLFTLGHSVTLSLAVLGYVSFPQSLAEIFIAFSIILTAAAVAAQDSRTLIASRPWLIAFVFGLLHGLGFAGALAAVGLPQEEIPLALFAFNVGIELGQLALIAGLVVLLWFAKRLTDVSQQRWRVMPNYLIGSLAGFWFWQRLALWLGF